MDDHDDFAFEPIRGLPERLPQGERLIWQGAPDWRLLAVEAFHVRKVAVYFAVVAALQVGSAMSGGEPAVAALSGLWMLGLSAAGALAILCGLAWLYARTTVYSLTSRRIVIRAGLALPGTLNLPLSLVETATVARRANGAGGVAFAVTKPNRVAWMVAWPNARPWRFNHPEPMFRALADVEPVARLVGEALAECAGPVKSAAIRPARAKGKTEAGLLPDAGQPA